MPRILGVNLLGVILAALAMLAGGYIWFELIFTNANALAYGWTEADYEDQNDFWRLLGFCIELVIAFGIARLLKSSNVSGLRDCVIFAFLLALLIAIPPVSYHLAYGPIHSIEGTLMGAGHLLVNFSIAGAILSKFE